MYSLKVESSSAILYFWGAQAALPAIALSRVHFFLKLFPELIPHSFSFLQLNQLEIATFLPAPRLLASFYSHPVSRVD